MNKITLFNTPYAKARMFEAMVNPAVAFLIKAGSLVILDNDQVNALGTAKLFSSTPISKLYQDIVNTGKLNNFLFINLTRYNTEIPQLLVYDDITVDGRVVPNANVSAQIQKCWINITPFASSKDSYNGQTTITDVTALSNVVVRAALCSTFDDSDIWINPKLATFLIESYSSTIGHVLRQAYNLNYEEQKFCETLFAAYFAQVLGGESGFLKNPALLMRCTFLGSAADILGRLDTILPYRENGGEDLLTPYKLCSILAQCGPARMNKLSPQQLYRFISASATDSQTMLIAIDYPPYWAYQVLRSVSGVKNPLLTTVMKMNSRLKTDLTQFANELQMSGAIVSKLNRG